MADHTGPPKANRSEPAAKWRRARAGRTLGVLIFALEGAAVAAQTPAPSRAGFGKPTLPGISTTCAAIEFTHDGDEELDQVFVFTRRPEDVEFAEWGEPQPARRVSKAYKDPYWGKVPAKYRALMRHLPPNQKFQVKVADNNDLDLETMSPASDVMQSETVSVSPAAAAKLELHRTDPRLNLAKHDGSVCVDLHWSHPHPQLNQDPSDVYFRIKFQYPGEGEQEYCTDEVGQIPHKCGRTLLGSDGQPCRYATLCGLRPKREVKFTVEAFNCDMITTTTHIMATTPPSAPSVITSMVTKPAAQESDAGFRPMAVIDWVPQHDNLIEGHAIYLGLTAVDSMKLMCYVPHNNSQYAGGHLEVPIVNKNHTYSEDSFLLRDYLSKFHVHQEQELLVATRSAYLVDGKKAGHLESPAYSHRLGDWLVVDEAVKCLTSFQADHPSYVSHPVIMSWTKEQSLSLYD